MRTADFDFHLPPELIAQIPAVARDQSRLLVLHRNSGALEHRQFQSFPDQLRAGDVLVLNNSRVIPARLRGHNVGTGGRFEMLLLEENGVNDWWCLLKPGRRAPLATRIRLDDVRGNPGQVHAIVVGTNDEGHRRLQFEGVTNISDHLDDLGEVPLPPYISRTKNDRRDQDQERYQTVFAQSPGSVAAPTAGLHFTDRMLQQIGGAGVRVCYLTLHVGLGTFAPVKAEAIDGHVMHEERYEVGRDTAETINHAKASGGRIVAVGTTTLRVLESLAAEGGRLRPAAGRTRIFIHPPFEFKMVDVLLTNFHLPRSTLLMLASAFAAPGETRGREMVLAAYREAVREGYRFFSYGDAMLLL